MEAARGNTKSLHKRLWFPASKKTLAEAYSVLITEYVELCGERGKHKFEGGEVFILRLQIIQLSGYIEIHSSGRDVMDKINELCGANTIQEAKGILNAWMVDWELAERQMKKEAEKAGSRVFDLSGLVVDVSRYLGYQLNRRETTVAEFAECVVSFKKYVEVMSKKNNGK